MLVFKAVTTSLKKLEELLLSTITSKATTFLHGISTQNAQYLFPLKKGFTIYPFAGLSYLHSSYSYDLGYIGVKSSGAGKLGLNLGGGLDYQLNDKVKLNVEPRFQLISGFNELVLNVGVVY